MSNKISLTIDLADILFESDGYGECVPLETQRESMRRQIMAEIQNNIKSDFMEEFKQKLETETKEIILSNILDEVKKQVPELAKKLINQPLAVTDRWGQTSKAETTFLEKMSEEIKKELGYNPQSYSSDRYKQTILTNAVQQYTCEIIGDFKKEFDRCLRTNVLSEAYKHALNEVAKAFDIKKEDLKKYAENKE